MTTVLLLLQRTFIFVPCNNAGARKLQGKRASDKLPTVLPNPATPEVESQKSASASQMSFDSRIENMDKLIQLLASQPGYAPNETDVKVVTLTTLLADMRNKNTAAINALTPLSNARISRNTLLYATGTGLVDVAGEVKKYVKSVFGGTSPQYKQVSGLKFTKVKTTVLRRHFRSILTPTAT